MTIHCCINKYEKLKPDTSQKIYDVEYQKDITGGYWSKRYTAYDAKQAKEKLLNEYPNVIYKRSKISK